MERSSAVQKLHMDFTAEPGRGVVMDDDIADLVAQLGTQIGMIMEDTCVVAISIGAMDDAARRSAIAEICEAALRISALCAAVAALAG